MNTILHTSVVDAKSSIDCALANSVTILQVLNLRESLQEALKACPLWRRTLRSTIHTGINKCDRKFKALKKGART